MSKTWKHGIRKLRLKRRKHDDKLPVKALQANGINIKTLRNDIEAQAEFCAGK